MKTTGPDLARRAYPGAIGVSGAAGRFGGLVIRRFHRTDDVVSIDRRNFSHRPTDVTHFRTDLRRKECRDIFRRDEIQAMVHLGPYHHGTDTSEHEKSFTTTVENFARLLEYCDQYHVKKLVLLSSADVYGARARNPQFLTEEAPLLAAELSALRDIDMMAQSFFWKRPDIETVILRPTHITGWTNNVISRYLRLNPVPRLMGYDPMMQIVHEEDVIQAIRLALHPGQRGIFNVAGPPPLPLTRILERLKRKSIAIPLMLARPALSQLHRLGQVNLLPSYVDYVRYVCMVDDSRAKEVLGYSPEYDLEQSIAAIDLWQ